MGQRQLKFRAWDNFCSKMITEESFVIINNTYHVFLEDGPEWTSTNCIIMQFTGLLDKNGKEIWEGDVVRYENKYLDVFEVRYNAGSFLQHGGDGRVDDIWCEWDKVEVIGNIYENPNLLEVNNGTPDASSNDAG